MAAPKKRPIFLIGNSLEIIIPLFGCHNLILLFHSKLLTGIEGIPESQFTLSKEDL